ncbi:methyl-accepting chemotaxis protein [uncultured Tolumonas sp.]|uniref:methyl-accepting chemotaxis protein n=1 Tax=uncultured Tolumonas sp. TaxID=263765 RepID=UPI002A0A5433|nr:methyl-accepting chemotaxis protein [uncultured Tolumonas sp.]
MFKHSLKAKILLLVNLAILTIIILLSTTFYSSQKELLIQQSYQNLKSVGAEISRGISDWIIVRHDIIKGLSNNVDNPEFVSHLVQARTSGNFALAFYGDENGKMLDADSTIDRTGYDPRTRDWYKDTKAAGQATLSKPYISASMKKLVVAFSNPVAHGVVSGVIDIDNIINNINGLNIQANGEAILLLKDGTVIAYQDKTRILKPASELAADLNTAFLEQSSRGDQFQEIQINGQEKLALTVPIPNTEWNILFSLDKATLMDPLYSQLIQQIIIALIIGGGFSLALSLLINYLFRPLKTVSGALQTIADGRGDLTQRIPISAQDEIGLLATNFNRFVGSLNELIAHIRTLASNIDGEADHGLKRSQSSVRELSRQQQELTMVATAVTEMASATQEIASNAERTAAAAIQSAESSEAGKYLVNKTRESISYLADGVSEATDVIAQLDRHAQEINGILATIKGIAEQTNLLALNAAIEAARAGEQGRGFAVVADEVRVLSQRTAASTTEIQSTIETLQRTTQKAVGLMAKSQDMASHSVQDALDASAALEEITRAVSSISDMANQIATAAEEQSHVTNEITTNVTAIKDVADELADDAVNAQEDANKLQTHAVDLNSKVAHFIL